MALLPGQTWKEKAGHVATEAATEYASPERHTSHAADWLHRK